MKEEKKKKLIMKISVTICFILICIFCIPGLIKFKGDEKSEEFSYTLTADMLNTEKSTQMELKENELLDIEVIKKRGILYFSIISEEGENIYEGTGITTSSFSIRVPKTSKYTIKIKGNRAKAILKIKKQERMGEEYGY